MSLECGISLGELVIYMDATKVGKAIKKLRLQVGYTQHDIADQLSVTDKAVSKWERGLSVPDISIITKLSIILNCDVDNLLEGNISYLEKKWQGLLFIKKNYEIFSGSEAYGKPLVYFLFSYFMLAGIRHIYVSCPDRDKRYIEDKLGSGKKYGLQIEFLEEGNIIPSQVINTMVICNNPFVYGPNLTKYFQRAMSRSNGISVLTVSKKHTDAEFQVSYDNYKKISFDDRAGISQVCVPIFFIPQKYFGSIASVSNMDFSEPLYSEPMGNGMIAYLVNNEETLWETTTFLRYIKKQMGKDIYNIREIAQNRNLITK